MYSGLTVLALVAACGDVPSGVLPGAVTPAPAPSFTLEPVREGADPVALSAGKPAVVNFLASWCAPCRRELPAFQQVWEEHGDEVAFVGVDVADNRGQALALLDDTGVRFPTGYDPDREVADRFRLRGMPTTVFVDGAGRVVGRVQGPMEEPTLRRWVDRLRGVG